MSQTEYINKIIKKYEITEMEDTPMIKDYAITKSEKTNYLKSSTLNLKLNL
jgi:hypothetical protein